MRMLGLDIGSKRVGVAVCDPDGRVATPVCVIDRSREDMTARVAELVAEYEAETVVVGLPRRSDGSEGPEAAAMRERAAELHSTLGIPVRLYDERFTTSIAHAAGIEAGVRNERRAGKVDMMAAVLILQGYIDRRNARSARRRMR